MMNIGRKELMAGVGADAWLVSITHSSIQKYIDEVRLPRCTGPTWSTLLHTQTAAIWACDFIQVTHVFFQSLFAFVIVELGSRRVVNVGVTRYPSDAWVAQQLREATPLAKVPNTFSAIMTINMLFALPRWRRERTST